MPLQHLPLALPLALDGVLRRADLVAAGLSADLGDRMVRAGRWQRLAPSVWLTSLDAPTDRQLVRAALAHAGPDAVVTGLVACRASGITYAPADGAVEVLVPAGRRRRGSDAVLVRPTLRPPVVCEVAGVRTAVPVRAVVDGARRLGDLRRVRALVCEAVHTGLCWPEQLLAELDAGASGGSAVVRRALRDVAAGAWSAPEAELADDVRRAVAQGLLPPFLLNPTLLLHGRVLGKPDGWFPGLGLGWEVESVLHHSGDERFDRTLARHDAFARHGLALVHVTPRRLRLVGAAYVEVLAEAVAARRRGRLLEPPGLEVRPYAPRRPAEAA